LSRQRGGNRGTRGEGETQLEIDRRRVLARIAKAKADLKSLRNQRKTRRALRERSALSGGSIVGYTNAGKSSLLKRLSGADILVEDKLFATLDPATRRVRLPSGERILLTDTVGFIRRLPHQLVEAFKSTLEETVLADFLIHVLDASDPDLREQARITREILSQIGAEDKPVITVFNKIDLCADPGLIQTIAESYPNPVLLSALGGEGTAELFAIMRKFAS
jgi:GTP-binding protein HflX